VKLVSGSAGFTLRQDKLLDELEMAVEAEGFAPGSPQFEVALRARKVDKCKELKGYLTCSQCPAVTECSLRLAHLRDGTK
jgi:hypothetical protein